MWGCCGACGCVLRGRAGRKCCARLAGRERLCREEVVDLIWMIRTPGELSQDLELASVSPCWLVGDCHGVIPSIEARKGMQAGLLRLENCRARYGAL